ncbi:MAG: terminase [Candidatus Omnitrophota bacterium]
MTASEIERKVIWSPQPGSQTLFLTCPIYECLYGGTRGPGKTDAGIMDFAQFVGRGFGSAWVGYVFRQSYPQLKDIVLKTKKWFRRIFPDAAFNESSYDWKWPTGEELALRYMRNEKDYWNYHGHERPWILFDELTMWATSECYMMSRSLCRSSEPGMPRHLRSTCNPYGPGHNWVKAYFVDPAPPGVPIRNEKGQWRIYLHGNIRENLKLETADPNYKKNIETDTNPHRRKAWLFGSWDITIGGIFDDLWNRDVHVLQPFPIPPSWRVDRAFDWGSSKPFSVGWWAESDGSPAPTGRIYPRGTLIRVAEWYGAAKDGQGKVILNHGLRLSAPQIAAGIKEREEALVKGLLKECRILAGPADPSIWDGSAGKSIAAQLDENGVKFVRGESANRIFRWQQVRERLFAALQRPMENPGLFVFDACVDGFLRTFPSALRDERNPDDLDTNQEDHCCDEAGYRVMGYTRTRIMKVKGL